MDLELLSLLAQAKVAYPEAEIDKLWHGTVSYTHLDVYKRQTFVKKNSTPFSIMASR